MFDQTKDPGPDLMRRFGDLIRAPALTTPDEWARANRVYGPETGLPGPRNPYLSPSMVPLGRAAVSGLYRRVVGVTGAQTGKTDTVLDVIGQRLDQRPTPILYVGPSAEFNRDQFEPRLRRMIDESAGLTSKLVRGRREKKTLKTVAGVRVRLASAASSTSLKSDPAGLALIDEYDEMLKNIRGQGDPLGLVEARGDTYADFCTIITSTPGQGVVETEEIEAGTDEDGNLITLEFFAIGDPVEIESPIWRLFQEGTRHHWAWHCPHCGVPFIPMRKHLHWAPGSTPVQAAKTAYLLCPHNGCIIEDDAQGSVKAAMNAGGFMIAPGQTVEDAKAGRDVPENRTYSQWSSGLASPFVSWGERAERLVKAEMSGEEDKRQTAVNANFGEVYSPFVSGDMPDWQSLLKHRGDYGPGDLPAGVLRLAMGVDVQKRGLYFVIRGFGARGASWLIDHGFLIGDTDEDDVWLDLANLMLDPIQGHHIEKVFIDSGFRPDKPEAGSIHRVYDFCRRYSFIATACKGRSTMGGAPYTVSKIEVKPDGRRRPFSMKLVMLDTDFFKSLVHSRIKTPIEAPGAFHLHREADEDYVRQLLSEVRLVEPGKSKPVWKQVKRANHLLDCEALAAAAGFSLNVQRLPDGAERNDVVPARADTPQERPQSVAQVEPAPDKDAALRALRSKFARFGARANK
ncbi:MAG: phage terminase large subunit family protein [Maritimibacter sp.]|nr:phage terminase large subunit family protein [Maritimibacter sp.]